MNKYLKILALSGGLMASIAPTAIKIDNQANNDLGQIQESVEKMQNIMPKLSRINYKLNIDLDTTNSTNSDNSLTGNTNDNVTFSTSDDDGNETELNKQETINYLNQTFEQANSEYEQLKATLTTAIKDTMDYLESYKNGETTLTNEQKIYIKEHTNSIKFLAETLEDLSEDVICAIDCKDCDEDSFEETTSQYLTAINDLEHRIQTLHNTISSLQFINNISNPYFVAGSRFAPNHIYGFDYSSQNDNNTETQNNNVHNQTNQPIDNNLNIDEDGAVEVEDDQNTIDEKDENNSDMVADNQNSTDTETDNTNTDNNSDNNEELANNNQAPTTFGLKSNIDTYAPTKRNIDTFFNTALQNNEYMYGGGYGYGMPYGYGGYGMPYGYGGYNMGYGAGFNNPYQELNSNLVNREVLENRQNTTNPIANIDNESNSNNNDNVEKPKKIRVKRAKNIDSYTGTTVESNINTMGESKISSFIKEKFNNLKNKVKNKKNGAQNELPSQENTQNTDIENNMTNAIENDVVNNTDTNTSNNNAVSSENLSLFDNLPNNTDTMNNIDNNMDKNAETLTPIEQKDINAQ